MASTGPILFPVSRAQAVGIDWAAWPSRGPSPFSLTVMSRGQSPRGRPRVPQSLSCAFQGCVLAMPGGPVLKLHIDLIGAALNHHRIPYACSEGEAFGYIELQRLVFAD